MDDDEITRPYAGESTDHPDPAPPIAEIKRADRLRAIAPALIGSLITGEPPRTTLDGTPPAGPLRARAAPDTEPKTSFDSGPSMRQRTDGTLVSLGPGKVVLEYRPDPDPARRQGSVVYGARRLDVLGDLFSRGVITKRQHDAAAKFLDQCSLASGGGLVANFSGVHIAAGPRAGLPEVQVSAITHVRQVFHLLGLNSGTVFWWVVFDHKRLDDYDTHHKITKGTASRMFKAALTALDEFYNGHS